MQYLLRFTLLLVAVAATNATYSKYGRKCDDILCPDSQECVLEEDVCTLQNKGHCGRFPTCKRIPGKVASCSTYSCPSTKVCKMKDGKPRCVDSVNAIRHKRQSYNPNSPPGDTTNSNTPLYPQLRQTTPSAPVERSRGKTTERPTGPNVYRIGQQQSAYPTQAGSPAQKQSNQGYPVQNYPNQGYPNQAYPNQNYPNQGYPNQAYPNQNYPNQGYPNQGYPNQGNPAQRYPNQGYPNQGYPNQGYSNRGYPSQGYPNQGYPNQGYQNQGYPNQGYANQGNYNQGYNPGYQNQWQPGPPHQQGGNPNRQQQNSAFDPILSTISRTVTQIGANYLKDKIFNTNQNNNNKPRQQV